MSMIMSRVSISRVTSISIDLSRRTMGMGMNEYGVSGK